MQYELGAYSSRRTLGWIHLNPTKAPPSFHSASHTHLRMPVSGLGWGGVGWWRYRSGWGEGVIFQLLWQQIPLAAAPYWLAHCGCSCLALPFPPQPWKSQAASELLKKGRLAEVRVSAALLSLLLDSQPRPSRFWQFIQAWWGEKKKEKKLLKLELLAEDFSCTFLWHWEAQQKQMCHAKTP